MEKVIDFRHLLSSKRTSINLLQKLKLKIVIEFSEDFYGSLLLYCTCISVIVWNSKNMKNRFGELCPNIAVNAGIQKLKTKTNKLK